MSESPTPVPGQPTTTGRARYPRSTGGLLGALIVTVLAVVAFSVFRAVTRDNDPVPVRAIDYIAVSKAARAEADLLVLLPQRLPLGWKATSANYDSAKQHWHLGLLTDEGDYVGVEESFGSARSLVEEYVDEQAEPGPDVTIAGQSWQSWSDGGGDYAVVRRLVGTGDRPENVLVVGTAPRAAIRELAGGLTAPVP